MKRRMDKRVLAAVVAGEVVAATLAWRDLGRRPDDRIRGPKLFWRIFVCLNPGNALVYWALGRRRSAA